MHCNLRPIDVAPVVLRFNYEAHTKFEVGQPMVHRVFNLSVPASSGLGPKPARASFSQVSPLSLYEPLLLLIWFFKNLNHNVQFCSNQKTWQLRMHCNLRQPDAAQSLSALILLPVASLKSLSLSVAVLERIYCLYVTLRCDLEL